MLYRVGSVSIVLLLAVLAAFPANAQLVNPSFESGLTGWTSFGGTPTVGTSYPFGGQTATDGSNFAWLAANGGTADFGIYQQIPWSSSTADARVDISTRATGAPTSDYSGIRIGIDPTGATSPTGSTVVWSAITSHAHEEAWDIAAVAVDGITSPNITIFVQALTNPAATSSGFYVGVTLGPWAISLIDNVRVGTLGSHAANNLDFEMGTLAEWYSHNAVDIVIANWWPGPYGHAIAPATDSFFGKTAQSGQHFIHYAEGGDRQKKCVLLQRFNTDIGAGIPAQVRAEVYFNRNGSTGNHWDQDLRIGIDPTGGVNPTGASVNWSGRLDDLGTGGWYNMVHTVNATYSPVATLFLENIPRWAQDNFTGIDNVRLYMDGTLYVPAAATPTPTPPPVSGVEAWKGYE